MVIWSFDWRKWLQELKKNELFANYTSLPQISLLSLCSQGSAAVVAVWTFVSLALLIRRDILLCSNTTLHGVQNNLSRLSCKTFVNPFARSLFVIFVLPVSRNLSVINPQLHTLTGGKTGLSGLFSAVTVVEIANPLLIGPFYARKVCRLVIMCELLGFAWNYAIAESWREC